MKKIFTLLIGIVFSITVLNAQEAPPQAFSFKATIKDKYGLPVLLKKINLRITILQGDMNGPAAYSEYFTPTSNLYSQVDVEIGRGIVLSGSFSSINWSADEYFLKIEADVKGGSNYQLLSVTQLLSVPYALYAGAAGNALSGDYNNLINKPTSLSQFNNDPGFLINETDPIFSAYPAYGITSTNIVNWNTAFSWGEHATAGYLKSETDGSVTNEIQDLTLVNDILKITNNPSAIEISLTPYKSDGSETKVNAGDNITVSGEGTEASPYIINSVGGAGELTLAQVLANGNDANANNIMNLANPVNPQDAATKAFVVAMEQKIISLMMDILDDYGFTVSVTDADGNVYKTKKIGNQIWMAENLKTTKYNDGTDIPLKTDDFEWFNLSTPGYCWYNNDEALYKEDYGALYNWYTVNTGKLCPIGWQVPLELDWLDLVNFYGGEEIAGGYLKEAGTIHWNYPNTDATNSSGFTALPGGWRYDLDGTFKSKGNTGVWWALEGSESSAISLYMSHNDSFAKVSYYTSPKRGYSVRCIKE